MNSKITKGRNEFNDENYEEALKYFDEVREDDEDYMYVLMFKITCLMELERYDNALFLIESLLAEDPEDEFLLYEKIRCQIALGETENAFKTLKTFEKLINSDNKRMVLAISKFYRVLGDLDSALKYCNTALEIDAAFEEAINEKSLIAIDLDDKAMIDSCANNLLEVIESGSVRMVSAFLLKLYVGNFDDCLNIISCLGDDFDEEFRQMLKFVVFKEFSEKLGVEIRLNEEAEIPVEEAISLLKDYDECGVNNGVIHGVGFIII